ncbi:hypothetical protein AOQ84DRAFT_120138 [Glonium stellatum]|uniref:F-box domain-containing protein n=1 Tax=Glonium stellatum TaxID=574774 RepID=A0A8E2ETG8_9PEZI|nr:hypothetical protein AOQ84DRAFT_120138 [Glonium stellatum]
MVKRIKIKLSSPAHENPCFESHIDRSRVTTHCNAYGFSTGRRCHAKATWYPFGMLAVCEDHESTNLKKAFCNFELPCGHFCSRQIHFIPGGFVLCPSHHPFNYRCPIMALPVELRHHIFSYVTPKAVDTSLEIRRSRKLERYGTALSLMLVNHQISEEAETIFYRTIPFSVRITPFGVCVMHRMWTSRFSTRRAYRRAMITALDDFESLFPKLPRIAKFIVDMECTVPYERPPKLTPQGSDEEDNVLCLRANIYKFLTAIGSIARMEVSFRFMESYHLASDERVALAKLVLQPFKILPHARARQIKFLTMYWDDSYSGAITWKGRRYEWPSDEPGEKEQYEQYVWDLAASFRNVARRPVEVPDSMCYYLHMLELVRTLLRDGVCVLTEDDEPADLLQAARIAEARGGLQYLADTTALLVGLWHQHAAMLAESSALLGRRLTQMAALAPASARPHVLLPPPASAASASASVAPSAAPFPRCARTGRILRPAWPTPEPPAEMPSAQGRALLDEDCLVHVFDEEDEAIATSVCTPAMVRKYRGDWMVF